MFRSVLASLGLWFLVGLSPPYGVAILVIWLGTRKDAVFKELAQGARAVWESRERFWRPTVPTGYEDLNDTAREIGQMVSRRRALLFWLRYSDRLCLWCGGWLSGSTGGWVLSSMRPCIGPWRSWPARGPLQSGHRGRHRARVVRAAGGRH